MSWQKCPICNGTGRDPTFGEYCKVCKGERILNILTGLPPKRTNIQELGNIELKDLTNLKNK